MSETLTFENTAQATIYGSRAGALGYLGAETEAWDDVATDESLWRLLVRAGRYLDRLPWADGYTDFATRDAVDLGTGGGDAAFPFRAASYLLADAGLQDESVFGSTSTTDIASMSAGGASVTYRNESHDVANLTASLPAPVLELIGPYLDTEDAPAAIAAVGATMAEGTDENPFGEDADFDRSDAW